VYVVVMWIATIIALAVIASYFIGRKLGKRAAFKYLNPEQMRERQENLDKILHHLSYHDDITNDEAADLLGVSHATAERYLDDLEHQGRLVQIGRTGRSVKYTLK